MGKNCLFECIFKEHTSDNNMREREKKEGTTQSMLVGLFARFSESYKSIFHFQWWIDLLELNETLWKKKKKKKKKLICVCYCSGSRHQRRHDNRVSSLASPFRQKHPTRSPSTGEAGGTRSSGSPSFITSRLSRWVSLFYFLLALV